MNYDIHGDIMYAKNIEARINHLLNIPTEYARDLDDWEQEELNDLRDFRAAVTGTYGAGKWETMSFVSDNYAAEYAQNQAEELYSGAQTKYWDVDAWYDDYYTDWTVFTLEDQEYMANGEA